MSAAPKRRSFLKRIAIWLLVVAIVVWLARILIGYYNVRKAFPGNTLQILEQADRFELLALDPHFYRSDRNQSAAAPDSVERHRVIGLVQITDASVREQLVSALLDAMKHGEQLPALCFDPRHGIRAWRGAAAIEIAICFECRQVHVGSGAGKSGGTISTRAEAYFNEVLRAGGVEPDYADHVEPSTRPATSATVR